MNHGGAISAMRTAHGRADRSARPECVRMPQPWTSSASASLDGGIVTLVEGSSFAISLPLRRHAPRPPARAVLPRHPVPVGAASPRERRMARAARRAHPRPVQRRRSSSGRPRRWATPTRTSSCSATDSSGRGMREDVTVHNYGEEPAFCAIELAVRLRLRRPVRGQGEPGREGGRPHRRMRGLDGHVQLLAGQLPPRRPPRLLGSRRTSKTRVATFEFIVRARRRLVAVRAADARHRRPGGHAALPVRRPGRARHAERAARGVARATCPGSPPTTTRSSTCSPARPRTSPRCGSSTPNNPTAPSSPPARPGS